MVSNNELSPNFKICSFGDKYAPLVINMVVYLWGIDTSALIPVLN